MQPDERETRDDLPRTETRPLDELETLTLDTANSNAHVALPHDLQEQFGRYRVIRKIGQGGMGSVYLAHDEEFERTAAIKVPQFSPDDDSRALERFRCEARAAARLNHPSLRP